MRAVAENVDELERLLDIPLLRYRSERAVEHPAVELSMCADSLAAHVRQGDRRAIEDACKLLAADPRMPFGKLIKSDLSRALRRVASELLATDVDRVVRASAHVLSLEYCPRETEDYINLVRALGPSVSERVAKAATAMDPKSIRLLSKLSGSAQRTNRRAT